LKKKQKMIDGDIVCMLTYTRFCWRPSETGILRNGYIEHRISIAMVIKVLTSWIKTTVFEENWLGYGSTISDVHAKFTRNWRCVSRESYVPDHFAVVVLACGGGGTG
jgi:hypothetical protein